MPPKHLQVPPAYTKWKSLEFFYIYVQINKQEINMSFPSGIKLTRNLDYPYIPIYRDPHVCRFFVRDRPQFLRSQRDSYLCTTYSSCTYTGDRTSTSAQGGGDMKLLTRRESRRVQLDAQSRPPAALALSLPAVRAPRVLQRSGLWGCRMSHLHTGRSTLHELSFWVKYMDFLQFCKWNTQKSVWLFERDDRRLNLWEIFSAPDKEKVLKIR